MGTAHKVSWDIEVATEIVGSTSVHVPYLTVEFKCAGVRKCTTAERRLAGIATIGGNEVQLNLVYTNSN